jgi:hypothetical protein
LIYSKGLKQSRRGLVTYRFDCFTSTYSRLFVFRVIPVPTEKIDYYMNKVQTDSSFKATFSDSVTTISYKDQKKDKDVRHTICKDVLLTLPKVIYTIKDFYLLDEFNDKIELLKSAGLIDFWFFQLVDKQASTEKVKQHSKSLNLQHFEGCFGILFCGNFVGFIALVFEVSMKKYRDFRRNNL